LPFIRKSRGRYTRPPQPIITGSSSEPTFASGTDTLLFDDNFDYASSSALRSAYGGGRNTGNISLVTSAGGPNGGSACRWSYGAGFTDDILFGPDNIYFTLHGNPTGPGYPEIFVTVWVRWSNGAEPCDQNFNGVKGFMFWDNNFGGARYEFAPNRVDNRTNALPTRWPKVLNQPNSITGKTVWKTADGWAPLLSDVNNGVTWTRVTFHMRTGALSNKGAKVWLNGTLVYDDHGVDVVTGFESGMEGYTYSVNVGGFQMFGNYIDAGTGAASAPFTLDADRWILWTH
jgi:hypothetical protein